MSKFKLIQLAPEGGDCTAPYDVDFVWPMTVGEFIEEILKRNEWGSICIYKSKRDSLLGITKTTYLSSTTYDNDKLTYQFPKDILERLVEHAEASGGWSNMSYNIIVEDVE